MALSIFLNTAYGEKQLMALQAGREIFLMRCAHCHGANGQGNGPSSYILFPKPTNFTNKQYMEIRTNKELEHTIMYGRGSMPAFKNILTREEIEMIIHLLRTF